MEQTSQTCSLAILSIETFRSDCSIPLTKSGRMRGRAMMLLARTFVLSAIPFMMARFPFDWQKDLTLLTLVARVREVLAVHPSVPVDTLQDLVAHAKKNPRKIAFGSAGTGTFTHLAVELLKIEAEIDVVHVPYRGAAPAVN